MYTKNLIDRFSEILFKQKDISSVVFFRVVFGLIMVWGVGKYLYTDLLKRNFITPNFHVTYHGFDWVQPLPENLLYMLFYTLVILAFFIAIGFVYRISIVLFFVGFSYVFLIDQSYYLNHYYLVILLSFLMIFIPANRYFSVDSIIWPKIKSNTIHSWCIYILMFQLSVVYFYGGLAKLNSDYVFGGEPVGIILHKNYDKFPLIGHMFTESWMVYFFAYSGLLLDLFIVPFLLWRKTRIYAYLFCVLFHLLNYKLFTIGIFPWFMIGATLIFFSPSWPKNLLKYFYKGLNVGSKFQSNNVSRPSNYKLTVILITIYILVQILIPFRHHLYPGNVQWGDEGYYFSWLMMGRSKGTATAKFTATDPDSGKSWEINPGKYLILNQSQRETILTRTHSILRLSHFFAEKIREEGYENIEVRANVMVSLNGRKLQYLVDPEVDLANEQTSVFPSKWITVLENPLPPRQDNLIHLTLERKRMGDTKNWFEKQVLGFLNSGKTVHHLP